MYKRAETNLIIHTNDLLFFSTKVSFVNKYLLRSLQQTVELTSFGEKLFGKVISDFWMAGRVMSNVKFRRVIRP